MPTNLILTYLLQVKGKKEDEGEVAGSPAKTEKDKSGDTVEEGEIRSSSKEKRRDRYVRVISSHIS